MSRMIDTANIRVGARNFYAAAHEMHGNAKHLDHIYQNLSSGQNGWKGEGAEAFQTVNNQMRDDCYAAARAFERTSSVLSTLAGMFDQVNQLRQQADHLDRQIDSLESQLWGAEETRRSSLRSEITQLRHRKSSLEHEADSLEYRAHSAASSQFQQIEAMANRLHYGPGGSAHAEEGGLIDKTKNFLGGLWDSAKEAVDEIGDKAEEFGDFLEAKAGDLEHFVEEKMDEWLDDEMEYYARIAWGNFGDFAEGAVCSFANNMTYGLFEEYLLDDDPSRGQAYFLGRIGGDAAAGAVGAALTEVGFGAASGGGSTAVAALAGGPAGWVVSGGALVVAGVGVAGMAYGGGVALHSAAQASKDWDLLMRAQGSGGGKSGGNGTVEKPVSYDRPSGFRKGVRDKVWDNAKDADGKVKDPLTGQEMDRGQPWDMGHKPGFEFRKHKESAKEREITRKEFLDEYNEPNHYRPELPSSNRSHKGEDMSDDYFGP
ncbi:HNH/ENDO VII family nuclease [Tumebacillus lacus]|uniref:HNH/ENDO VII family nuclease n=1 Tax=Tumebacillus lacus TaxID=2995335 RepID=UPI002B1FA71F|nr:GH-E family nuclease [Tumebacillus lacus]